MAITKSEAVIDDRIFAEVGAAQSVCADLPMAAACVSEQRMDSICEDKLDDSPDASEQERSKSRNRESSLPFVGGPFGEMYLPV